MQQHAQFRPLPRYPRIIYVSVLGPRVRRRCWKGATASASIVLEPGWEFADDLSQSVVRLGDQIDNRRVRPPAQPQRESVPVIYRGYADHDDVIVDFPRVAGRAKFGPSQLIVVFNGR